MEELQERYPKLFRDGRIDNVYFGPPAEKTLVDFYSQALGPGDHSSQIDDDLKHGRTFPLIIKRFNLSTIRKVTPT